MLTAAAADSTYGLTEQQQDVPVELGRALHIAALPALAHQVGHVVPGDDAPSLQVPLVAHDQDGGLRRSQQPSDSDWGGQA